MFKCVAGTAYDLRAGEHETDAADTIMHMGVPVKGGVLHAEHPQHVHGRTQKQL